MCRLPLLLVSAVSSLIAFQSIAWSQTIAAADVTSMLAKSHAFDARCDILAEADRQDLMDYLARAEILLAESESVKAARTAIAKGKAAGGSGACGPAPDKFVRDILAAARASTVAEPTLQQAMEPPKQAAKPNQVEASSSTPPALRQVAIEPEQNPAIATKPAAELKIKTAKKKAAHVDVSAIAPPAKSKPLPDAIAANQKTSSSLGSYAGLAQRYYVELKCRSMSGSAVKKLYANVLANHKRAVAENGPSAVRSVLRSAEARANARNC